MDWIIHLDTDELLHPAGAKDYSLQSLLGSVAADVDMVVFPNYVSCSRKPYPGCRYFLMDVVCNSSHGMIPIWCL